MRTRDASRDRRALVREAGHRSTSPPSILAGTLVAFGAIALVAAVAGAVGSQLGLSTDGISTEEFRDAGIAGAAVAALVLFLAFFFGGYTAGRMSSRAGLRNGLLVFVLAVAAISVVAGLAAAFGDGEAVADSLSDSGVPTDGDTWSDIGIGAGVAALAAMLLGAVLGGIRGDRWHGRILHDAETRRVERENEERNRRILREHDDTDADQVRGGGPVERTVGQDATTVDVRNEDLTRVSELSVEEERERARTQS